MNDEKSRECCPKCGEKLFLCEFIAATPLYSFDYYYCPECNDVAYDPWDGTVLGELT